MEFLTKLTGLTEKQILIPSISLLSALALKLYCLGPKAKPTDLTGKIVIVTGSSDGIGVPTAEELLKHGATVIYACRTESKTKKVIDNLDKKLQENAHFMKLDQSSLSSVYKFAEEFRKKFDRLDILVNNAGAYNDKFSLTEDDIESTLQVNTLAPMYLTFQLLDLLHKSNGRVVNLASKGHVRCGFNKDTYITKLRDRKYVGSNSNYNGLTDYMTSKLGNVYFNQYLHNYIQSKSLNVNTYSLHPGVIITELLRNPPSWFVLMKPIIYPIFLLITKTVWRGAQTTLHCCYSPLDELKSGAYYSDCKEKEVAPYAEITKYDNRTAYLEWAFTCMNSSLGKKGLPMLSFDRL